MSTLKSVNLQHPSSASPNIVLDSSGNATMAGSMAMATPFAMRNKIINGAMEIDQRNAGAAVDANGGNQTYPVDRFYSAVYNTTGNTTGQQSATSPTGFINSMKITVKTADTSVGSTDQVWYGQNIEGLNIADFGLGTASATTFTISFWVYSNVTGTYCVCLKNSAENRTYVAEYTINSSATWEKKTITVTGDTTGTWLTTNGTGLKVWFVLMAGSGVTTSANAWSSAAAIATSNQVNFMSSTANYWQITGVQLEVGSVATPFERRIYSQELAMCQRYFQFVGSSFAGQTDSTSNYAINVSHPNMRTSVTLSVRSGGYFSARYAGGDVNILNPTLAAAQAGQNSSWTLVASSGLTANLPANGRNQNQPLNDFLSVSAEL